MKLLTGLILLGTLSILSLWYISFGSPKNPVRVDYENEDGYFKLHQATVFYEAFLAENCPIGRVRALELIQLKELAKLESSVRNKLSTLKDMISAPVQASVLEFETFRYSIHEIQEQLGLQHYVRWHDEVKKECQKSSPTLTR